jgi:hypothetical protein
MGAARTVTLGYTVGHTIRPASAATPDAAQLTDRVPDQSMTSASRPISRSSRRQSLRSRHPLEAAAPDRAETAASGSAG